MAKTVLGIDIAYEALKICALTYNGSSYRLVGLSYAPIPKDSWTADELKNREEIVKVLNDSIKSAKPNAIDTKLTMIALPENAVYSATFSMPIVSKNELLQALPYEVGERLSINPEEYYLDYETLSSACQPLGDTINALGTPSAGGLAAPTPPVGVNAKDKKTLLKTAAAPVTNDPPLPKPTGEPEAPHQAIFAVAAKRTLVESVMEFCKSADLNLAGIDIKAGAIVNALIATDDHKMRLVVDLGASTTGVTIAEGKSLHLISSVPLGTKGLGDNMTGELEQFKAMASPIFDELVHATKFFENRMCPGRKISEIVITGGAASITGIVEFFEAQTGLKTVIGNPFSQIDTHRYPIPDGMIHKFADSVGLAMRGGN